VATLIGDGAHARDIQISAFVTRSFAHHSQYNAGVKFDEERVYIGVNDPRVRDRISREVGVMDLAWEHPSAVITDSRWGIGTHINAGAIVIRTTIGHHCTISPGVTICGDVIIGDRTLIGAGATICDRVTIGNDVTVGAGAVVLPEATIPDGETWVGVPAKPR
jgi:acetyltransferase-like isoleucine patch superfamily enzyme